MRLVVLLLGIMFVVSLTSETANACSCGGGAAPCESYGTATAVFAGTVISFREPERTKPVDPSEGDWAPRGYKFSVQQSYSGVAGAEIEVFTGRGGGDCGYQFKIGERYLVYAFRDQEKLTTSICSSTKLFSKATEDLAFLGTLSSARPGVTIHGAVTRGDNTDEPLSQDILITVEGESQRKEIRPDAEGRFSITGLPAGKYKATLHLPDTLTTWRNESELTVSDRGCAPVGWYITDNGRVNGRVLNAEGEPVAGILVGLIEPGGDPKENHVKSVRTDEDGNFKLSGVTRGRYQITVNHTRFPDFNDPTKGYPPTFYPGVVDQTHAETITIGAGEKLNDLVVRVPSKRPASALKVSAVWSDGSPVAKAIVTFTDVTQGGSSIGFAVAADEQGHYTLNGYVGQELVVEARSNRRYVPGNVPMERSDKVRLTLDRATETIRIVITKIR